MLTEAVFANVGKRAALGRSASLERPRIGRVKAAYSVEKLRFLEEIIFICVLSAFPYSRYEGRLLGSRKLAEAPLRSGDYASRMRVWPSRNSRGNLLSLNYRVFQQNRPNRDGSPFNMGRTAAPAILGLAHPIAAGTRERWMERIGAQVGRMRD
jgi:hypothetical protein